MSQGRRSDTPTDPAAEFSRRQLSATAPSAVTSSTTPDAAQAHVKLLAATDQLTVCAADRLTLAAATGELMSLDHSHAWLWLDPDENTATVHQTVEFLAEFGNPPVDLDGWARAHAIGIGLAGYDQAQVRRDRFNEARYASGMQAHGGMADTLLRDAYALTGSRPPRQLASSM